MACIKEAGIILEDIEDVSHATWEQLNYAELICEHLLEKTETIKNMLSDKK